MAFFLRPKDTNLDKANNHINAEAIVLANGGSGRIPTLHPSEAREALKTAPLPSGSWRTAVSKTISSGFGRGTRAGK